MSVTSVYPPTYTPGGWFGCFGPPSIVANHVPLAWPVSGQEPCGNGTVESCCIIGDQCLSNGVCQIMPVANEGQDPLYYGAYCTDPTFSSPECTSNCAVKYMAYCGSENLWQCGNTDRTHPISCNLTHTTKSDSSTFFMVAPTKLATGRLLPSTEPSVTQAQFIPTQWGRPQAYTTSKISAIESSTAISPSPTPSNTSSVPTAVSKSPIPSNTPASPSVAPAQNTDTDSQSLSRKALSAIISIATISAACIAAFSLFASLYPDKARRGCTYFWSRAFCLQSSPQKKADSEKGNTSLK